MLGAASVRCCRGAKVLGAGEVGERGAGPVCLEERGEQRKGSGFPSLSRAVSFFFSSVRGRMGVALAELGERSDAPLEPGASCAVFIFLTKILAIPWNKGEFPWRRP